MAVVSLVQGDLGALRPKRMEGGQEVADVSASDGERVEESTGEMRKLRKTVDPRKPTECERKDFDISNYLYRNWCRRRAGEFRASVVYQKCRTNSIPEGHLHSALPGWLTRSMAWATMIPTTSGDHVVNTFSAFQAEFGCAHGDMIEMRQVGRHQ